MSTAATCRTRKRVVSIDDRAFKFGDGVYEVCEVRGGALIDETRHLDRLERSLDGARIASPIGREALRRRLRESCARNRVRDGLVYLQITRGAARRDHGFPPSAVTPGLVVSASPLDPALARSGRRRGVAVVTVPETAGRIRISRRSSCCPTCSPSRPRARRAPSRPGSSIATASSPRAPRPTPGSSPPTARSSPGRPTSRSCAASTRATLIDVAAALGLARSRSARSRREEAYARAKPSFPAPRRSPCRSSSLDGRPDRRRPPGPGDAGAAARLPRARRAHLKAIMTIARSGVSVARR